MSQYLARRGFRPASTIPPGAEFRPARLSGPGADYPTRAPTIPPGASIRPAPDYRARARLSGPRPTIGPGADYPAGPERRCRGRGITGRISFITVNTLELLAIYVGIPAVICGFIAACTLLPGRAKEKARLRYGPDWDYPPQWWAGDTPVQLPSGDGAAGGVARSARGGARGAW